MKVLMFFNGLAIAAMLGTFVWAGFAIGHENFQDRMAFCFAAQAICIMFIIIGTYIHDSLK